MIILTDLTPSQQFELHYLNNNSSYHSDYQISHGGGPNFGPGGFIGLVLVFILAAILRLAKRPNIYRDNSNLPLKVKVNPRTEFIRNMSDLMNRLERDKRNGKTPRFIIRRKKDGYYASQFHLAGDEVFFYREPYNMFVLSAKETVAFFATYNNNRMDGYMVETVY